MKDWEERVRAYEELGCTRSDAQGIVDAEDNKTKGGKDELYLSIQK